MSNSVQICGADIPSKVFEWLAKGQQIQTNICGWTTCSAEGVLRQILNGNTTFRLKPRTVKIGKFEVEAPVLEPAEGQELWFCTPTGEPECVKANEYHPNSYAAAHVKNGRAFASAEAAVAAFDAIRAILRGEA